MIRYCHFDLNLQFDVELKMNFEIYSLWSLKLATLFSATG